MEGGAYWMLKWSEASNLVEYYFIVDDADGMYRRRILVISVPIVLVMNSRAVGLY